MNTTDWWRTVKLPFVKEKQEPSCVRPSLRGWEETAGRKPRLQSGTQRLSCRLRAHCRLHWFGLLTPVGGGGAVPPAFSITTLHACIKKLSQKGLCKCLLFSSQNKDFLHRSADGRSVAAAPLQHVHPRRGFRIYCFIQQALHLLSSSSNGDSMEPELQKKALLNHLVYESV